MSAKVAEGLMAFQFNLTLNFFIILHLCYCHVMYAAVRDAM